MAEARCHCGWRKPLISIVCRDGSKVTEDLVPIIVCPSCHCPYPGAELTAVEFDKLLDLLADDLTHILLGYAAEVLAEDASPSAKKN